MTSSSVNFSIWRLRWRIALSILMLLLFGTACATRTPGSNSATGSGSAVAFDQLFIDMMVPHHEGAVAMAQIAQQRAQRPEIKQMAEDVIRAQDREIAQMKGWRNAWFGSDQTPPMSQMPMVAKMPGHRGSSTMDMAADVEALRKAAEPFDRAFIDAMIPHHQSAIDAARVAGNRAEKPEIKQLAQAIIADQQREIDQMKTWRQSWFGQAEPAPHGTGQ